MPNHVTNQITFGADSVSLAAFQHMLRELRAEGQPLGSIDFNKLVPMPPELKIECGSRTDAGLKLYKEFMAESTWISSSLWRKNCLCRRSLFKSSRRKMEADGVFISSPI